MRGRNSRREELGFSGRSVGKDAECYHAGDDNRRAIQGMVELSGCVAIPGAGAG